MNNGFTEIKGARLKNYTTFKIGGKVETLIECYKTEALIECVKKFGQVKVLGRGSNILASDNGYDGVILINRTSRIEEFKDEFEHKVNSTLHVPNSAMFIFDSGVRLSQASKFFLDKSLSGLEFASGIPGTMGGAVFMNAGAHLSSISDVVEFVDVLRNGEVVRLTNEECEFGYRNSKFKNKEECVKYEVEKKFYNNSILHIPHSKPDIILRVGIRGTLSNRREIFEKIEKYREFRRNTQPSGFSAGSVFKSAEKPAGYYIDNAGLKGLSIDGAEVSKIHANFIINTGFATAKAVKDLIKIVKARVKDEFGVELDEEIEYI